MQQLVKFFIVISLFTISISCHKCKHPNTATVIEIIKLEGKYDRKLVKIIYEVGTVRYTKEFVSSYKTYNIHQKLNIKTADNPNHFCLNN
ncbi:MAG: hypothetical protein ACPGVH_10170 [Chitinophagales bacterium]